VQCYPPLTFDAQRLRPTLTTRPQQPPVPPQRTETETAVLLPPPSATVTAAMQAQNGTVSVCFKLFSLYIKSSFTHCATMPPAAPPQAHTCHSTHDRCSPHSRRAQTANHPRPRRTGQPPTAPTPLARPDTGVQARISCDDNAGKWTDQTRDHQRRQH